MKIICAKERTSGCERNFSLMVNWNSLIYFEDILKCSLTASVVRELCTNFNKRGHALLSLLAVKSNNVKTHDTNVYSENILLPLWRHRHWASIPQKHLSWWFVFQRRHLYCVALLSLYLHVCVNLMKVFCLFLKNFLLRAENL